MVANGHDRIERIFRVLQDHRDTLAANGQHLFFRRLQKIDILEHHVICKHARLGRLKTHNGAAGGAFARTGLADNADFFSPDVE